MAEPSAFSLARHFTRLVNRPVEFSSASSAPQKNRPQAYGLYCVRPDETPLVLQADLGLLGSMAGAILGLPDDEILQRLQSAPMDDLLEDAMREICSVASGALACGGRAAFRLFTTSKALLDPDAQLVLAQPRHSLHFQVAIEGYSGGCISIFE